MATKAQAAATDGVCHMCTVERTHTQHISPKSSIQTESPNPVQNTNPIKNTSRSLDLEVQNKSQNPLRGQVYRASEYFRAKTDKQSPDKHPRVSGKGSD